MNALKLLKGDGNGLQHENGRPSFSALWFCLVAKNSYDLLYRGKFTLHPLLRVLGETCVREGNQSVAFIDRFCFRAFLLPLMLFRHLLRP